MKRETVEVGRQLAALCDRPASVMDAESRTRRRGRIVARMNELLQQPMGGPSPWLGAGWFSWATAFALGGAAVMVTGLWMAGSMVGPKDRAFRHVRLHGSVLCEQRPEVRSWGPCDDRILASGDGLRTLAHAQAELETQAGVRLELGSASELSLTAIEPGRKWTRVSLGHGRLDVRVPPLTHGAAFSVVTPQATVTVHGTAFVVEVAKSSDGSSHTCVRVSEGAIVVRHASGADTVLAGGTWGCHEAHPSNAALTALAPAAKVSGSPATDPSPRRERSARSAATEASTLGTEAGLLQKALGAERAGDFDTAERTLATLLRLYPNSIVAPEARAALERVQDGR